METLAEYLAYTVRIQDEQLLKRSNKMNLYELNQSIANFEPDVDELTGELLNADELDGIMLERDAKIENLALYIKNLAAESEAIKAEAKNLTERAKAADKKIDWLKKYLSDNLQGEKFETPRCKVSFRKSKKVLLDGAFDDWAREAAPELLTVKTTYTPSLTAIREAIESGANVKYATVVENKTIQIK